MAEPVTFDRIREPSEETGEALAMCLYRISHIFDPKHRNHQVIVEAARRLKRGS